MTLAEGLLSVMWVGVTLYALFGGADFGGGFWDLFAGGTRSGARRRALIERSIAPVWEANHVWLIFVLVVLWTGFPDAFAPIMATLVVPLTAAAVGVILRGSGFAFRKAAGAVSAQRAFGAVFAASSVITPFFLGTVAGAVASGRVPREGVGDTVGSWINPTSVLGGSLAVAVCAYLATVFLTADAATQEEPELVAWFRRRALVSATVTGALALGGIGVLAADAPTLFDGLTGGAAPLIGVSAVAGSASMVLLWRGSHEAARYAAALAVTAVVWGWAAAQHPFLLVDELTIEAGAGARSTLWAMLGSLAVTAVLVAPPLVYLLVLSKRGELAEHSSLDDLAAGQ